MSHPLPLPPFGFFMETPILLLENASIIAETNFTLGPIPKTLVDWPIKNVNFLYNSGLFSPKILGPLATFEASCRYDIGTLPPPLPPVWLKTFLWIFLHPSLMYSACVSSHFYKENLGLPPPLYGLGKIPSLAEKI